MTDIAPGLADPPHDAQRLFRAVLEGFSHPGRIVALPQPPAGVGPLSSAATAFVLTLIDRDTPLWLAPRFDVAAVRAATRPL
ncbi:MAG: phosphonate C-P lyase system protein PhnH [Reyranellales bacterium]